MSRLRKIWHILKDPEFYERVMQVQEKEIDDLNEQRIRLETELHVYQEKLEQEIHEHHRAKNQTHRLWNFIALRSRVDVKAVNGTARASLKSMERR